MGPFSLEQVLQVLQVLQVFQQIHIHYFQMLFLQLQT
jgi:hypothetical protein